LFYKDKDETLKVLVFTGTYHPPDPGGDLRMSEFGQKLLELRTKKGLTVKEVCKQVGIPQSRLSELERGVRLPTSGQIERLENFYGVDSHELASLAKLLDKN
jgi:ribosome-binding protein aMBF1 (putative translation factor)